MGLPRNGCPWHQWYTWRWPQDGRERPQQRSSGRRPSHHRWSPLALLHHSARSWDVPKPERQGSALPSGANKGWWVEKTDAWLKEWKRKIGYFGTSFFEGRLQEWSGFHSEGHLCMVIWCFQFHLKQSVQHQDSLSITEQQQTSCSCLSKSEAGWWFQPIWSQIVKLDHFPK